MSLIRKVKKLALRDYVTDHPRTYRRFGALWLLRYRNYIDRKLILGERYEDPQLRYCAQLIKERGVSCFIDAGANFGLYSVSLAASLPALSTVVAFEPDRRNFNHLCANIYLNSLDVRIDARRMGLSHARRSVSFLVNKGNSTGMSRIAETAPAGTKAELFEETIIEVDTLDSQLAGIREQLVYLKIDVEGHEQSVIAGGRSFLERNRCFLQMEILSNPQEMVSWVREKIGFSYLHHIGSDYFFERSS